METFSFTNGLIKFEFSLTDTKRILISYFGDEENYIHGNVDLHSLVELETADADHLGSHCAKFLSTPYGSNAYYLQHEVKDIEKGSEMVISTTDDKLCVETHILLYKGVAAYSIYNVVTNVSNKNITLERVSSSYIIGLGNKTKPSAKDMYIHYANNSWQCEAQWRRRSFIDEGIFNGNDNYSMKSYMINNVGSWSTKDYLPMCVVENAKTNQFTLIQVENNGSWNIEIGCFREEYYLTGYGPDYEHSQWVKVLKPNDKFSSVQVTSTIGNSFEKIIQELTKARRMCVRPSLDNKELPVIFNDYMHALWDAQTEKLIWPLVDLASQIGCEEFVIDAGWFAEKPGWTPFIGEWKEYSSNFPSGGLKGTIDYIHSKGMKAGLWVEIENMGTKADICKSLPDSWFFISHNERVTKNTRNCLNFANPEVYKWAMDIVSNLIEQYGLDYIKNDYNLDAGVGNEFGSDSLGDGLLKHNRAYIKWLNELMDKYPNLTIENCGSGGCRMDYEVLKTCPIQSTSDQTDYRKYPYLSSAVLTACTPEQAAVWSYPLNKQIKEPLTNEVVVMNMVNAMLGRIHLASFINELSKQQIDLVIEGVNYYKATREFKKNSLPIFPNGVSYFFDENVVGGLINNKKIILCMWNTKGEPQDVKADLSKYKIRDIKVGYPTSIGTSFEFIDGNLILHSDTPYQGRVFEIDLI